MLVTRVGPVDLRSPRYLKSNVRVRPHVARWPANEQLIPPIQYALNARHKHLELLEGYLSAPEEHYRAANTENLKGGPWVDVPPSRAAEVAALLDALRSEEDGPLGFADAIGALDRLLDEAKGSAMAPLYERIPPALRGMVELVYDFRNSPGLRFIEPLVYRSRFHKRSRQAVGLTEVHDDVRVFQDQTPLLDDPARLDLTLPFADPAYDMLYESRRKARPIGDLAEALGVRSADLPRFAAMFTAEAPRPPSRRPERGVRVRYFGHACVLFETPNSSILTDPLVSYEYPSKGPARYSLDDLPERIDYVVLTHFHKDHVDIETLHQLRPIVGTVVIPKNVGGMVHDPSFRATLGELGFKNIAELDALDTLDIPDGRITALPFFGEHSDLDVRAKAAHLLELCGRKILCAADSDNIEPVLYERLHSDVGDLDALFMGMESVGAPMSVTYRSYMLRPIPRRLDQQRRTTGSDYNKALRIVEQFRVGRVYVYAMGLEPWLGHILPIIGDGRDEAGPRDAERLIQAARARGSIAERPYCKAEFHLEPR